MKNTNKYKWNLGLLYSSPKDPAIEADMVHFENICKDFAAKYDRPEKPYMDNPSNLLEALADYEELNNHDLAPFFYFYYLRDLQADNIEATAKISLLENRIAKAQSLTTFFTISLGKISGENQKKFLVDQSLAHYRVFLKRIFDTAKYTLSVPEENILNLKNITSNEMWVSANERMLNMKSIIWKEKTIPLSKAFSLIPQTINKRERYALADQISKALQSVSPFSEAELNAIITDKKIEDDLRGFKTPEQATILSYRNDPEVVERLVQVVTKNFAVSKRFYKLKSKLLKLKKLNYADRAVNIGKVSTKFTLEKTINFLKKTFGRLNPSYSKYIDEYISRGQIDALPRIGKTSGAYCSGSLNRPTFILLNHSDDFRSFTTFAHELGHAFHTEFSRAQGPLYHNYSTSLAETASTLFESIAREAIFESLPKKEKIVALHDKINEDIATVFRQVACYNLEKSIHAEVREKGFIPKERFADLHNEHMRAYLGPIFRLERGDGYFFVQWSHIRRYFYVYTYAYGMLTSKALLRKFKKDPSFWKSIERFLKAGGKDSPEAIMKEIGIDMKDPAFFEEGIREIESEIKELENLIK